jgi:signal transduction histidine kinase
MRSRRREQRLRAELARRARHDLRTPLTVARGHLELIQLRTTDASVLADVRAAIGELDRLAAAVTALGREPDDAAHGVSDGVSDGAANRAGNGPG